MRGLGQEGHFDCWCPASGTLHACPHLLEILERNSHFGQCGGNRPKEKKKVAAEKFHHETHSQIPENHVSEHYAAHNHENETKNSEIGIRLVFDARLPSNYHRSGHQVKVFTTAAQKTEIRSIYGKKRRKPALNLNSVHYKGNKGPAIANMSMKQFQQLIQEVKLNK